MTGISRVRSCSSSRSWRGSYCDDEAEKRRRVVGRDDLLSSLPESMICHVFMFLPIKDIVRTSVLSKSWRTLWYKTPALSFSYPCKIPRFDSSKFLLVVDRVLFQCTSLTIQKLHLLDLRYHPSMQERLDLWLRFAVEHRVEDIRVVLNSYTDHAYEEAVQFYVLPITLFRCQSIVKLHLSQCDFSLVSGLNRGITWTSLKVLHIDDAKVGDDVFDEILSGSPLLEYLKLRDCRGMMHLRVHSQKLRELVIDGYTGSMYYYSDREDEEGVDVDDSMLVISAPHVQVLRLLGYWAGKTVVNLDDVSSLVECEINFELTADESDEDVVRDMLRRLFSKLSCVNKLVIGRWFLQVLPRVQLEAGYLILNCRNLVLSTAADEWELAGIVEVLKCTLFLEKLVIDLSTRERSRGDLLLSDDVSYYQDRFRKFRARKLISSLYHLKSIEVSSFVAYFHEVECWLSLINMLLADTLKLEEMTINVVLRQFSHDVKSSIKAAHVWQILDVAQEIMRYQRCSDACKVIFNYPFMKESSQAART